MPRSTGGACYLAVVAGRPQPQEWGTAVRAALPPVVVGDGEVLDGHCQRLDRLGLSGLVGSFVGFQQVSERGVHGISPVVKITTSHSRCE